MNDTEKNFRISEQLEDANKSNWVDSSCPSWSKPFLKLSRLDRPVGAWLLLIPCFWGLGLALVSKPESITLSDLWIVIGCIMGSILMRGAGCTWNDINDKNIDAHVKRTRNRPIPSGQISIKQATIWMLIQMAFAFLILLTFNKFAIVLGISSLIPVMFYPFAKRLTWWPQLFLGVAFNWGILLAYVANSQELKLSAISLYISGIFWTLFYDTIYAHQDTEDDLLVGVKSTALLFGKNTKTWLASFAILSFLFMEASFFLALTPIFSMPLLILSSGGFLFALHLFSQIKKLDINDTKICLKLFKSNKNAGLLVALLLALSSAYHFYE